MLISFFLAVGKCTGEKGNGEVVVICSKCVHRKGNKMKIKKKKYFAKGTEALQLN